MATQLPALTPAPTPPRLPPESPPVPLTTQVRVCGRGLLTRHGPRPFLLYGQGRLGSTLLGSLLSSHPQVTFGNEVLRGPVRAPGLYLQGLRARAGDRHYGCHVKPYHLTDFQGIDDPARWLRARHRAGWLVVHLQRRNTLLHVLSNVTRNAMTRSHFQQGDGQQVPRIAVDTAELLTWMQHRSAGAEAERLALVGLPVQEVVYEDDLLPGPETWAAVTARLFAALDLAPCPVDTSLRKINPRRLEDFVANADEVRAAVAASRFADCVADA